MVRATEKSPSKLLAAPAFSSFLVREANNEWRRKDVLLECFASFLCKNRDLNKPMRSLALFGINGWLVEPFVDGLSPPPLLNKDRTLVADQPYVVDCGDGVFDRGTLDLTVDQHTAALQRFGATLFSNTPYAWLAQQFVVVTMDGASLRVPSLLVGAPTHVRLPRR